MEEGSQKEHRKKHSGPKAVKKKGKNKHEQELTPQQRNPKAFAIQSITKTERIVRRSMDIQTKKHHIPVVDRTPVEPPPVCVAIVGPPKVGKTTLMNCLIKNFTKQKLSDIQGPVTIVSGKKRRLTLIECNNDINAMIDIAKVADLVLLLVDASFGFEMETFEFLNICQIHGFPKIMGVLTHLDMFRNNKQLRKTKKRLKHRFWTEIYQGAKLFYLSGMVNGEYQKTEIHNLGRFISVMKFRPLQWRTTHPYVVADRFEDVTDPENIRQNAKCDRTVCLYGYTRGTHFKNNSSIHIPGCGDFSISDISFLPDPCPLPEKEKKRSLNEKERSIYAPMSGVGGIVYDKDAVYIDLGGSHHNEAEAAVTHKPSNEMVLSLIDTKQPLDYKMASSEVSLFKDTAPIRAEDIQMERNFKVTSEDVVSNGQTRRRAVFDDDEDEDDDSGNEEEDDEEEENSGSEVEEDDDERDAFSVPKAKKRKQDKVEKFAFDDDDDDDSDDDDTVGAQEFKLFSNQKGKVRSERLSQPLNGRKGRVHLHTDDSDTEEMEHDGNNDAEGESEEKEEDGEDMESGEEEGDDDSSDTEDESDSEVSCEPVRSKQKLHSITSKHGPITSQYKALKSSRKKKSSSASASTAKVDDRQFSSGEDEDMNESKDSNSTEDDAMEDAGEGADSGFHYDDEDEEAEEDFSDGSSSKSEEETSGELKWKDNLALKASDAFFKRQSGTVNWRKLVYGQAAEENEEEEEEGTSIGGLFKIPKKMKKSTSGAENDLDCTKFVIEKLQDWDLEEMRESIKDCFVTGKWDKSEDAKTLLEEDDELYGDFEDLETGDVHHGKDEESDSENEDKDKKTEDKEENKVDDDIKLSREEARKKKLEEKRIERKRKLKHMFDSEYDEAEGSSSYFDDLKAALDDQAQLNRKEFDSLEDGLRVQYEGFRPGMYVRVEIDRMPCEFVTNFDASYPIILGGLLNVEETIGYLQVRLKKHRWHKKILKTRDPLILSLGWRRFQTIPLYTMQDHNGRNRLLKYTPQHLHCHATMWGPITPQNTGVLAIQTASGGEPGFRVAATGVVVELDKSFSVVKKLKLTGTPLKIYKKTAFIQGMFSTSLEVSKFEGASIRTVSGIRGQIKKAVKTPPGAFRATFEDKILLSDIVFVRTWYQVSVPNFYNPVTTMMLPKDKKSQWQGMKTLGQLRRERGIKLELNEDSRYRDIERKRKAFKPLVIPKNLQRNLPFKDKPKVARKIVDDVQKNRIAVIREPKERKVHNMMKMLKTLHQHKMKQRHAEMRTRAREHQKSMAKIDKKREKKQKEIKKEVYRVLGQIEKKKNKRRKD